MEITRKLASVQRIVGKNVIPNADRIELVTVLGWNVIAKKDEFSIGDLCVFFEIDSILPDCEVFSFLKKHEDKPVRIKTMRMRGVVSQGLVMPLSILKEFGIHDDDLQLLDAGMDLTNFIGVEKYTSCDDSDERERRGTDFPEEIPKTDSPRFQSYPRLVTDLARYNLVATEKLDGSSATYAIINNEFVICSRRRRIDGLVISDEDIKKPENRWHYIAQKYDIEGTLRAYMEKVDGAFKLLAIQGEICGPKVQNNRLGLDDYELYVFDVYYRNHHGWGNYLNYESMCSFCENYGLNPVPEVAYLFDDVFNLPIDSRKGYLIDFAEGKSLINPDVEREGIIIKCPGNSYNDTIRGRLQFKIISNKYLLEIGE